MSTQVASSRPSTLRGPVVVGDLERELDLVDDRLHLARVRRATSTNISVIEMMSPTSSDDDVRALLVVGGLARRSRPGGARRTGRRRGQAGSSRSSSPASVEARAGGWRARPPGGPARRSGARRRSRSRRSVEEMSRRGIDTRSTRHPLAGRFGVRVAGPLDDDDRGEIPGLVEPPPGGMLATASAPSTRNSSRPGAAERLERVGGDRRRVALDLDRRRLDAVDAVDRGARPARGGRRADATTRPRFCHGSPATTSSTRSRPSCARVSVGHDDVADVHGIERAAERPPARSGHRRECTGASCLHPRETFASSSPVPSCRERCLRAGHPRPGAGLAPRPARRARPRRVAHRCGRRRHRRHRRARAGRQRRGRRVRGGAAQGRSRSTSSCARSRRSTARASSRCAPSTTSPTRASTRSSRRHAVRGDERRRAARDARRPDPAPSSSPTGARSSPTRRCSRRRATPLPTRPCSRRSPPAPRRRRASPTAPPGPTTSRWRRSPDARGRAARRARRPPLPPPRARPAGRARRASPTAPGPC